MTVSAVVVIPRVMGPSRRVHQPLKGRYPVVSTSEQQPEHCLPVSRCIADQKKGEQRYDELEGADTDGMWR